jgi:hypothetical protein
MPEPSVEPCQTATDGTWCTPSGRSGVTSWGSVAGSSGESADRARRVATRVRSTGVVSAPQRRAFERRGDPTDVVDQLIAQHGTLAGRENSRDMAE